MLQLSLLGKPLLMGPAGLLQIPIRKGQALLWYLAAHPHSAFSRSHLATLLWEGLDEAGGRNNLTTTLIRLRRSLPAWPLRVEKETLGWDSAACPNVDTLRFPHLTAAPPGTSPAPFDDAPSLAAAADLWRGPFLDGFSLPDSQAYDDWLQQERSAWDHRILEVLGRLAQIEAAAANWDALVTHCRRALAIDPLQERFHRWLMLAHYGLDDRAAALSQFEACRRLLRQELGVDPAAATAALREAILREQPPQGIIPLGVGPATAPGVPFRAASPSDPPLVGRSRDLAQVEAILTRAGHGQGCVVLLHGEAGIGKTRLAQEILRTAQRPRGRLPAFRTLLVGHCYETGRELPYAPFVEALGGLLQTLDPGRLPLPAVWLAEVGRLLPDLAVRWPDLPPPQEAEPGQERHRLCEGVARFLAAVPRPALLALEDLHWADETSLALLAYLARHPARHGITVLATARAGDLPEQTGHLLRQLQREGRLAWHEVGNLSATAMQALVTAVTGREDAALGDRLYAETQGNPLFAVEVLRSLQESGEMEQKGTDAGHAFPIPALVQSVISNRLVRLPQPALDLLSAAAIFPAPVSFDLLRAVAEQPEEAAIPALEALLRAGILREGPDFHAAAARPLIRFSHDLIARVVREGLSRTRREWLHRRAYRALAAITESAGAAGHPDLARSEALAFHATAAGLWAQGLTWSLRAADAAEGVYAYAAVVRSLEQALSNLERLPPSPKQQQQRLDLHLRLARADFRHRPARAEQWLAMVETDVPAVEDPDCRHQAWLDRVPTLVIQGRLSLAASLLDGLIPELRRSGNRRLLASGLTYLGWLTSMSNKYRQGIIVLEEAVPLHQELGNDVQAGESAATLVGFYASVGEFDRAEALVNQWIRKGREMGNPAITGYLTGFRALVAHFRGQWAEAVTATREALRMCRAADQQMYEYIASLFLGLPLARLGHLAEGIRAQEESIRLSAEVGMRVLLDRSYAWLAEMHLEAGDVEAAETAAAQGLAVARKDGYPGGLALNTQMLGRIAAATGAVDEARRHIALALERFIGLEAKPETARCHALLTDLAETEAQRTDHRLRAEALFRAMGMAWDLARLAARGR